MWSDRKRGTAAVGCPRRVGQHCRTNGNGSCGHGAGRRLNVSCRTGPRRGTGDWWSSERWAQSLRLRNQLPAPGRGLIGVVGPPTAEELLRRAAEMLHTDARELRRVTLVDADGTATDEQIRGEYERGEGSS